VSQKPDPYTKFGITLPKQDNDGYFLAVKIINSLPISCAKKFPKKLRTTCMVAVAAVASLLDSAPIYRAGSMIEFPRKRMPLLEESNFTSGDW